MRSDSLFPDHPGELWFPAVTAEEEHEDEDGDDDRHDERVWDGEAQIAMDVVQDRGYYVPGLERFLALRQIEFLTC